ncbi:hypothetical protein HETIRDRAFT_409215 [Heterobasidion irregulare TC 32-1]|uniref:Uncharacterized protein n=1 Tax=Heterobasidion irregulare (strain TC 32-1) TaxID=747525 RepID=W4KDM7_HETIT|nr:uncharacterized protein HETIRDRAFT_409215 [Heterobasidion irregulare TC 32-1]ETW83420.1 hypothetical protein HETIRDRAFT_409215 [Heterobasidion irregulare TC 32-1]
MHAPNLQKVFEEPLSAWTQEMMTDAPILTTSPNYLDKAHIRMPFAESPFVIKGQDARQKVHPQEVHSNTQAQDERQLAQHTSTQCLKI